MKQNCNLQNFQNWFRNNQKNNSYFNSNMKKSFSLLSIKAAHLTAKKACCRGSIFSPKSVRVFRRLAIRVKRSTFFWNGKCCHHNTGHFFVDFHWCNHQKYHGFSGNNHAEIDKIPCFVGACLNDRLPSQPRYI